jgi:hypothetical protein
VLRAGFDHIGHIIGVARRFGGVEKLTRAVKELQGRAHVT